MPHGPSPVSDDAVSSIKQTAALLHSIAAEANTPLDEATKSRTRALLLQAAKTGLVASVPEEAVLKVSSWRTWFALGGASAVLATAALVLFFQGSFQGSSEQAIRVARVQEVNRLVLPPTDLQALFTIQPVEAQTPSEKTAPSITFHSQLPLTLQQVRDTIQVTPSVPLEVTKVAKNTFRVQTKVTLATEASYRLSLPTLVTEANGSQVMREFAWPLTSDEQLQLVSTTPTQAETGVPIDTNIVFRLNHTNIIASSSTISLVPSTAGRLEVHGSTLTFIPATPLLPGTLYEATVHAVTTTGGVFFPLEKTIQFETELDPAQQVAQARSIRFSVESGEAIPQEEAILSLEVGEQVSAKQVDLTGYALTLEQAQALLKARALLPLWSTQSRRGIDAYTKVASQEAFRLTQTLTPITEQKDTAQVFLPKNLPSGFYAIRLTAEGSLPSWMFLQITSLATQVIADDTQLFVWTIDAKTHQSVKNAVITSGDEQIRTDEQGIARLSLPATLVTTTGDTAPALSLMTVRSGPHQTIIQVSRDYARATQDLTANGRSTTWGSLTVDRPWYRSTDTLSVFGVVRDRSSHIPLEVAHLALMRSDTLSDPWTGTPTLYQEVTVRPDEAGRFQAALSWDALLPGEYVLVLMRDTVPVLQHSFTIHPSSQARSSLELVPRTARVLSGEPVMVDLRALSKDGVSFASTTIAITAVQKGERTTLPAVSLDAFGRGQFSYLPQLASCAPEQASICPMVETVTFEAQSPTAGQSELHETVTVDVYASPIRIDVAQRIEAEKVTVSVHATVRDLREEQTETPSSAAQKGMELVGQAIGYWYEAIPQDPYFNIDQNRWVPSYRYERRQDTTPLPFRLLTDTEGRASYSFPFKPDRDYYEVILRGNDGRGRVVSSLVTVSQGWSEFTTTEHSELTPKLQLVGGNTNHVFQVGTQVGLRYLQGTTVADMNQLPGILVYTTSGGIKSLRVLSTAEFSVPFDASLAPNGEIHAITFSKGRFEEAQTTVFADRSAQELSVTLAPEATTVLPGTPLTVRVHVEKKDGTPLGNTMVRLTAIHEKLFAVAKPAAEEPLEALYQLVPNGLRYRMATYDAHAPEYAPIDQGIGGTDVDISEESPQGPRADTALIETITLDRNGNGIFSFVHPRAEAAWQLSAVAWDDQLGAGAAIAQIRAESPVQVDVLLPTTVRVTDAQEMVLRAFAPTLPLDRPVNFLIDAPTLGLVQVPLSSTGTTAVFPLPALSIGTHEIRIRVRTDLGDGEVTQKLTVTASTEEKPRFSTLPLEGGAVLAATDARQTSLLFTSHDRLTLLPLVQSLARKTGNYLPELVAREGAERLLREGYDLPIPSHQETDWLDYQSLLGGEGLKMTPDALSDSTLTAEIVSTDARLFDEVQLRAAFFTTISTPSSTRLDLIQALVGLVALHEPMLADLRAYADEPDLSVDEKRWLARGLWQAGDQGMAVALVDSLLQQPREKYSASQLVDLATLSIQLQRPDASDLITQSMSQWQDPLLPALTKLRFLRARWSTLPVSQGEVRWSMNGAEQRAELKEKAVTTVTLTPAQLKDFQLLSKTGAVEVGRLETF